VSENRRREIERLLQESDEPLTGSALAVHFHVTRQIIVKDIALLKAHGSIIVSTAKGYLLEKTVEGFKKRIITVCHDEKSIEDELRIIVDLGGHVLDTAVSHPVYGQLGEALNIRSRKDITLFLKKIKESGCTPLLYLTKGIHSHTIEAEDENSLDEISDALKQAGYLIL